VHSQETRGSQCPNSGAFYRREKRSWFRDGGGNEGNEETVRFASGLFRELLDGGRLSEEGGRVDILGIGVAFGNLFLAGSPRLLTTGCLTRVARRFIPGHPAGCSAEGNYFGIN